MKILYYDLETTGLDYRVHAPIQFSGLLEINGGLAERIEFTMSPYPNDLVDIKALEINRRTLEEIKTYEDPTLVLQSITDTLDYHVNTRDRSDKIFLCGYNNATFDDLFFREWFKKAGRPKYDFMNYFWNESLDMRIICAAAVGQNRSQMDNFQLSTVAKHFGIEIDPDRLHDATYDTELVRLLTRKISVGKRV